VPEGDRHFFLANRGEHYRLLAYFSMIKNNSQYLDIGTLRGASAVALAYNRSNKVISYDISNNRITSVGIPNVEFRIGDVLEESNSFFKSFPLISLDVDHSGAFEKKFMKRMKDIGFSGLLLLDDINLNEPMRKFWNSIKLTKYDLTGFGHHSGTGLVDFTGKFKIYHSGSYSIALERNWKVATGVIKPVQ